MGSLFAGIGGFDLAFEQAGFETKWQVEINADAQKVLERHWPMVPKWGDITTVDPTELDPVDVIAFGSPCQDLSVAGKRAGLGGERSGLFYEAIRLITALRPAFAVWENVPGAFSSNAGRDFAAVLAAFRDSGVRECAWRVLDAQYFGVPQRRRRVFLVADYRGDRATQILFEPQSLSGDSAPRSNAGRVIASLLASGAGTSRPAGLASETDFLVTARTLLGKGNDSHDDSFETHIPVAHNGIIQHMAVRRLTPRETERLQGLPDNHTRWDADGKELSDYARYRLVGNSVAVPVVRWIATRMFHVITNSFYDEKTEKRT